MPLIFLKVDNGSSISLIKRNALQTTYYLFMYSTSRLTLLLRDMYGYNVYLLLHVFFKLGIYRLLFWDTFFHRDHFGLGIIYLCIQNVFHRDHFGSDIIYLCIQNFFHRDHFGSGIIYLCIQNAEPWTAIDLSKDIFLLQPLRSSQRLHDTFFAMRGQSTS